MEVGVQSLTYFGARRFLINEGPHATYCRMRAFLCCMFARRSGAFALGVIELRFTDTDVFGGDFHQFVFVDPFEGTF